MGPSCVFDFVGTAGLGGVASIAILAHLKRKNHESVKPSTKRSLQICKRNMNTHFIAQICDFTNSHVTESHSERPISCVHAESGHRAIQRKAIQRGKPQILHTKAVIEIPLVGCEWGKLGINKLGYGTEELTLITETAKRAPSPIHKSLDKCDATPEAVFAVKLKKSSPNEIARPNQCSDAGVPNQTELESFSEKLLQ